MRRTVLALRRCDRAVTADDFQALALAADNRVVRAHCIPRRDITRHPNADAPSHVSVALLPRRRIMSIMESDLK